MKLNVNKLLCPVLLPTMTIFLLAGCAPTAPDTVHSAVPSPSPVQMATPEPSATPSPAPSASNSPALYTFGVPLEESQSSQEDSSFDDAVFLGDSRTEGLQLFSGIDSGDFYWQRGMTVFRVDNDKYKVFSIGGQNYTLIGALSQKSYQRVYIMIGINELGYPVTSYETGLAQFLDQVIAIQPNAVIYLQTLPPINDQVARSSGLAEYQNNDNVNAFNQAIVRVAKEKHVVLLDTAQAYRGEDGQLPADLTIDGCHFHYDKYSIWADYLRRHVLDPEQYAASREYALTNAHSSNETTHVPNLAQSEEPA